MYKRIFILEDFPSEILYDYINLVFNDVFTYKIKKSNPLFSCFCCKNAYESVVSYSGNSTTDKFVKLIIELSIKYLNFSSIKTDKLTTDIIECIKSDDKILIENSNKATVVFHFNDFNKNGYVTTHDSNLNFLLNDSKYVVVTFK